MLDSVYSALYLKFRGLPIIIFGMPSFMEMILDSVATIMIVVAAYYGFKILLKKHSIKGIKHFFSADGVILTLIFLGSFLLRLLFINDGLFHHDSVALANSVKDTVSNGVLHTTVGGREALVLINSLFYLLLKNFFKSTDLILNLITILFSSASIIFIYLFVREFTGKKGVALMSACLFSLAPVYFSETTYAKSHGMDVFFAVLSGYLLIKGIKTGKLAYKVSFGIVFGISLFVRITNVAYIIPYFFLYFFSEKILKIKRDKNWMVYALPMGIMILALVFVEFGVIVGQLGMNPIPLWDLRALMEKVFSSFKSFLQSVTIPGFILAMAFIYSLIKRRERIQLALYASWILLPFFYFGSMSTSTPRFLIPILLPFVILISLQINSFLTKDVAAICFLSVALLMFLTIYPVVDFRHNYCAPKEGALFVKLVTENNAVIISKDDHVFFEYYADRQTMDYPANPKELPQFMTDLVYLLDNNIPVYVTQKMLESVSKGELNRTLSYDFNLENKGSFYNEDYHQTSLRLVVLKDNLYKISKKESLDKNHIRAFVKGT